MTAPVLIRINVAGYSGRPASVFAALDDSTGILAIAREADIDDTERPGFLRITNQQGAQWSDALFSEDMLREAVAAFFELESLGMLIIKPAAQRCDPKSKLERDGIDAAGTKYRFAPDISCGQVAVLAAAWYAQRQRGVRDAREATDEFMTLIEI